MEVDAKRSDERGYEKMLWKMIPVSTKGKNSFSYCPSQGVLWSCVTGWLVKNIALAQKHV